MSDDLDFIVIDDIPEYTFCIPDDEEFENVIPIKGEDGGFKYEKVAELPETGEDGVLYLVPKSHETQTASGNPISINVTEGAGKLSDLKLDGNATQSASPNPDYPQDINVVTGTQTIDINGTSYPINLGNIELAEIGTYQDRIYKDDGKWYVEKQVDKVVLDGMELNWFAFVLGTSGFTQYYHDFAGPLNKSSQILAMSDYFVGGKLDDRNQVGNMVYTTSSGVAFNPYTAVFADLNAFKAWLSTHPTTVYYALATSTTTEITNTSLIAQLEAVRTAQLANGTNVISNAATGANLAGDLELSYYEYDPTNRYNKWLWLADDAAYEQM